MTLIEVLLNLAAQAKVSYGYERVLMSSWNEVVMIGTNGHGWTRKVPITSKRALLGMIRCRLWWVGLVGH